MLQSPIRSQNELRNGLGQMRQEIDEIGELFAARRQERTCRDIKYQLAALRFETALIQHALVGRKAGFNPDQLRVPAGSREGGQWTSEGGDDGSASTNTAESSANGDGNTSPVMLADASGREGAVRVLVAVQPHDPGDEAIDADGHQRGDTDHHADLCR